MKGFYPRTSFGHETSRDYDAVSKRGDEEETVAFLAGLAGGGEALELAVGTGRIALPLMKAGVRVDGIELSKDMVDRMLGKPGGVPGADRAGAAGPPVHRRGAPRARPRRAGCQPL